MWHEARKQEKKIREVMVDFQRRAERRREHYDKLVRVTTLMGSGGVAPHYIHSPHRKPIQHHTFE